MCTVAGLVEGVVELNRSSSSHAALLLATTAPLSPLRGTSPTTVIIAQTNVHGRTHPDDPSHAHNDLHPGARTHA